MRPFTNYFFAVFIVLFCLSGCATMFEKPAVVYKTQVIALPDNLLQDCPIIPPPDKAVYLAASAKEKEKMLIELADKNIKNGDTCNVDRAKGRQWKKEQLERIKAQTKGE